MRLQYRDKTSAAGVRLSDTGRACRSLASLSLYLGVLSLGWLGSGCESEDARTGSRNGVAPEVESQEDPIGVPTSKKSSISFGDPQSLEGARSPFALVDSNTDGRLELWTAGGNWRISDTPQKLAAIAELSMATGFSVADYSGDGVVDLAVGYAEGAQLLRGVGSDELSFSPWLDWSEGFSVVPVPGDIDEDGELDILLTEAVGPPQWRVNPGDDDASWSRFETSFPALDRSRVHLARVFGANSSTETPDSVQWFLSNEAFPHIVERAGAGFQCRETSTGLIWTQKWRSLAAGDLDLDGEEDLVVASGSRRGVWYQRGGRFVQTLSYEAFFSSAILVQTADLDRDGRIDFLVMERGATRIYRNLGERRFAPVPVTLFGGVGMALGDLDGDLDPDVVLERADGTIVYYENTTDAPPDMRTIRVYPLLESPTSELGESLNLAWDAHVTFSVGDRRVRAGFDGGVTSQALDRVGRGRQPIVFTYPAHSGSLSIVVEGPGGRFYSEAIPESVDFWLTAPPKENR